MKEIVIEAVNVSKNFDGLEAVKGISFVVYHGECFGFLGPNGAGKTTTVKMIHCVLPLTSGTMKVDEMNVSDQPREIKCLIGVAPQEDNLDPDFSVLQNLLVYARYFDVSKKDALRRSKELLDFLQLDEKQNVVISALSTGMKRRLILARALINDPKILLLDEPTTGLDPQARHLVWDKVRALKKQGITIILTTHYMDEAAELCDRILIMDNGRIIEEGEPMQLVTKHVGEEVLEADYDKNIETALREAFPDARLERTGERIRVFSNEPHGAFAAFLGKVETRGASIRNANLEDVFLKLTGRGLRE